jgi:hypothetical protein
MNRRCRTLLVSCVALGLASLSAAGEVRLQIRDGRVTLDARNATIREIFAEWARVGQTRVINAERAPGQPMTVKLEGVPEREALDIVLRSAAGFVAVPRAAVVQEASVFDRIMLMPGARPATVPAATGRTTATTNPQFPQFQLQQRDRSIEQPVLLDDQDEPLPDAQMPLPNQPQPAGAPQPGMVTQSPQMPQMPTSGPGGVPPTPPAQNQRPAPDPNAYGAPYVPSAQGAGTGQQTAPPTTSAPRPGMPTAPPPPPQPIKR